MGEGALAIPGLALIESFLSNDQERALLAFIDAQPWRSDLKRRVQHYGYRYDYRARKVGHDDYLGTLPVPLQRLAQRLVEEGHLSEVPDQAIINEYLPGQGIAMHVDCEPCFGDAIASVSLGSACEMQFRHLASGTNGRLVLNPQALLVLKDAARYDWQHGIAARKSDVIDGQRVARDRRVSVTFRRVQFEG